MNGRSNRLKGLLGAASILVVGIAIGVATDRIVVVGGRKGCPSSEALIRRVAFSGEEPETLSAPPRVIRSVFYLPDGRLAWTLSFSPHAASYQNK